MSAIDWAAVFDIARPEPGVPPHYFDGDLLERWLFAPPSEEELKDLRARPSPADPTTWTFPARPLPPSFRAFLRWSNGGLFVNGDCEFGMLGVPDLREYLLIYDVPDTMPGAVPFALNGGGCFYLFDLRGPPDADGEYPILFADTGDLDYAEAAVLAPSFPAALRGRTSPDGELPRFRR